MSASPQLETIIAQARQQGVCHDDHLPFLLQPAKGNGYGVLLVHGFTASPREMNPLAQFLTSLGFTTVGVRLPGHGTSPEDLATRNQEEWQQAVEDGYLVLRRHTRQIFGVGLSTGALLLIPLAARHPLLGMILLSPFLRVKHRLAPAAGLLRFVKKYQHRPLASDAAPLITPAARCMACTKSTASVGRSGAWPAVNRSGAAGQRRRRPDRPCRQRPESLSPAAEPP
ncbi:MAG: alpha/beta fold hydrolase [Syntrophotaleaceae bacterium]